MRNFQSKPLDFLLHLTFFLLLLFPTLSHAAYLHSICSNRANYTANSTFGANLNQVLSVLSDNARSFKYFYDDKGDDLAIAYGFFVCRGDITTDLCSTCVDKASQEIKQRCHMTTDAVIGYDYCMLRYSDRRFKSAYDPAYNSMIEILTSNAVNASDPQQFYAALNCLMERISLVATYDPSVQKFAIGDANYTNNQTIYGLVQCTQDLTNDNCNACLKDAISIIPKCCDGKTGERLLGANCILVVDVSRFYYESSAAPTADGRIGFITHISVGPTQPPGTCISGCICVVYWHVCPQVFPHHAWCGQTLETLVETGGRNFSEADRLYHKSVI